MRLRLEFPDKHRLWSELVKSNTDRVFVETPVTQVKLGTRAQLELAVEGALLVATAEVVALRMEGGRFRPGVWVKLPKEEVLKVRRFLGLADEPTRSAAGRAAHREPCNLEVVLRRPAVPQGARLRNLSDSGGLLETSAPLIVGQFLELELKLDDGSSVLLSAEVARETRNTWAGLHFIDLGPAAAQLHAQLERLRARPASARQQVLVADDDDEIREFLTRALAKHGYEVLKASSGREAMALIREAKPSLVLLDILMPGMDGVDICKTMRADAELSRVPVIFASALDQGKLHQVADEAGATDYLAKPLTLGDLLNVVGRYLKGEHGYGAAPHGPRSA